MKDTTKDVMLQINGKTQMCTCLCNVFRWIDENHVRCNACGAVYEAVIDFDKAKDESNER